MTDLLASFAINLMEFWIFILLMQYVCSAHLHLNRKHVFLCSAISLLTTLLAILLETYHVLPYVTLFCMPLAILLSVLLCSLKWTDVFLYFPAFALYFILAYIPERILVILIPSLSAFFVIPGSSLTVTAILSDLILLLFLLLLRHVLTKYRTSMHFSLRETIGSIGLVFFSMIDVMLLMNLDRSRMAPGMYAVWTSIFVGLLFFGIGYYLYNLMDARARLYHRMEAENEIQYLKMQLESLKDIEENEDEVRKLRHDLSNHLTVIQSFCNEGSYDEAKKYAEELHENISPPGSKILSANKTADLVLRNKMLLAESCRIPFTFDGSLEKLENMKKSDLCSLLSNAYDNAIEACKDQQNPYIHTKVHTTRHFTVIQITNPVAGKVPVRHLTTTKKEKSSHGYGARIMREITQRYNGTCVFSCTDREFTVKITLPEIISKLPEALKP